MTNRILQKVSHLQLDRSRALVIVAPDAPCSYAMRNPTKPQPCAFCVFWNRGLTEGGMDFENVLETITDQRCKRVELFTSGSMLDDRQIKRDQLAAIVEGVAALEHVSKITLECRPEHATSGVLSLIKRAVGEKRLEIAIGLETAVEWHRLALGKGFTNKDFEDAIKRIGSVGAGAMAYLLAGLWPYQDRTNVDLFESAEYLRILRIKTGVPIRVGLETYFPPDNHSGRNVFTRDFLTPEFIAGVARAMVRKFGLQVTVALSAEGIGHHPLEKATSLFAAFNASQDIRYLNAIIERGGSK